MSCDKLVFDLSQEVEGSPNVFIRKDWLNILDNQNQNYQNNQSIIDTSQLANSNKYMAYREAYLAVPMLLSMSTPAGIQAGTTDATNTSVISDYAVGLKNWFGSIIHSMTLDYNGTTIVQQTPFCNMWNAFKLLTTLSWNDVMTQGPTIGFYPDTPDSFAYFVSGTPSSCGVGTINNDMGILPVSTANFFVNDYTQYQEQYQNTPGGGAGTITTGLTMGGNQGLTMRTKWIAYPTYTPSVGQTGGVGTPGVVTAPAAVSSQSYTALLNGTSCNQIWKSQLFNKRGCFQFNKGLIEYEIMATIQLKHIHSFFNMCPLLKGVFMKITLNLNNCATKTTVSGAGVNKVMTGSASSSYVGGICPIMIPSIRTGSKYLTSDTFPIGTYTYDLVVGGKSYNTDITSVTGYSDGQIAKSIYLYVPAYTFNPTFEQAYLSNNIKQIKYTDIYQYQVLNVGGAGALGGGTQFNNLITNGIANIKSVLIIPFFATDDGGVPSPFPAYASPFDPAGAGPTSPLVALGNFNVQISGQNAIYNMQRYGFEEWNNQLYGQNAVNGGLTDGLTSGLIDYLGFQTSYCYYYVNVERMLPVEQSVPKSVQIIGTNYSQRALNLWVFVEYGVQVSIDVLTGARV